MIFNQKKNDSIQLKIINFNKRYIQNGQVNYKTLLMDQILIHPDNYVNRVYHRYTQNTIHNYKDVGKYAMLHHSGNQLMVLWWWLLNLTKSNKIVLL